VCYHVVPQYWAWAPWRARRLAKAVDLGLVTLPFEADFFGKAGLATRFVGHPLADRLAGAPAAGDGARVVGLLPGGGRGELEANLPGQLGAARRLAARLGEAPRLRGVHPDERRRAQIAAIGNAHGSRLEVGGEPLPELLAQCRVAL